MITGKHTAWPGIYGIFLDYEIEIWDSEQAVSDLSALAALSDDEWFQEDVCVGDWVVDCIDYDETITPDILIIARKKSGMALAFLLKITNSVEKLGTLMRASDQRLLYKSIFSKFEVGANFDIRLVLAKPLEEGIVHMIPYEFVYVEGTRAIAMSIGLPRNK